MTEYNIPVYHTLYPKQSIYNRVTIGFILKEVRSALSTTRASISPRVWHAFRDITHSLTDILHSFTDITYSLGDLCSSLPPSGISPILCVPFITQTLRSHTSDTTKVAMSAMMALSGPIHVGIITFRSCTESYRTHLDLMKDYYHLTRVISICQRIISPIRCSVLTSSIPGSSQ